MASFGPITANWGPSLPKPGQVIKPPAPPKPVGFGRITANWGPSKPGKAPPQLKTGVASAGSGLIAGQQNLTQGAQPPSAVTTPNPPASTPAPSPSDLDSTYYANVNNYLFNTGNKINADQLKSAADQTALQSALGQIAYAQPRAALALEQRANQTGGLYSSVYGQNLANLNQKYLTEQNADTTKYGGDMQSLAAAIAALNGSVPLYEGSQALASAGRLTTAAQNNPALGANPPAPPAPAPGPGTPAQEAAPGTIPATVRVRGRTVPNTIISRAIAGHPTWAAGPKRKK